MARIFVQCCSRCGEEKGGFGWTRNDRGDLHVCADGIVGSLTEYDKSDPASKPKLPGDAAITGGDKCPNCGTVAWNRYTPIPSRCTGCRGVERVSVDEFRLEIDWKSADKPTPLNARAAVLAGLVTGEAMKAGHRLDGTTPSHAVCDRSGAIFALAGDSRWDLLIRKARGRGMTEANLLAKLAATMMNPTTTGAAYEPPPF